MESGLVDVTLIVASDRMNSKPAAFPSIFAQRSTPHRAPRACCEGSFLPPMLWTLVDFHIMQRCHHGMQLSFFEVCACKHGARILQSELRHNPPFVITSPGRSFLMILPLPSLMRQQDGVCSIKRWHDPEYHCTI